MSQVLDLQSEPYGVTGNIGDNFRRLLGAPSLNPLETVIRESVQNVVDAARVGAPPEVLIRLRRLSADQRRVLGARIFRELPPAEDSEKMLGAFLARPDPIVLEICDFGTTGLGGPTRADRIPLGCESTDFISFMRNVGTPRDTDQGGGTYGFGKVSLYRASKCSTILVDTKIHDGGKDSRRFMGCHVGTSFHVPDGNGMLRRYTGRHWWGTRATDEPGLVDPAVGDHAADLADSLGMPVRNALRTGTSIMVLDFDPEDDDLEVTGRRVVECLLWHFWPRMTRDTPAERRLKCSVEVEGISLPIPEPEAISPLDLFSRALSAARAGANEGGEAHAIMCGNPRCELGTLAIQKGLRTTPDRMVEAKHSLFPEVSRHVALMRPVELVVKYLEGPEAPDQRAQWAGVFLTSRDSEVEQAFADSEPPAHDDWIPTNLPKGRGRTFVNVGLRRIREMVTEVVLGPVDQMGDVGRKEARLAGAATRMGSLLNGITGSGAGPTIPGGRNQGRGGRRKVGASRAEFVGLELHGQERVAVFRTRVTGAASLNGRSHLVASATAVADGSALDVGGVMLPPVVLNIEDIANGRTTRGTKIVLGDNSDGFRIRIAIRDDYAVECKLSLDLEDRE